MPYIDIIKQKESQHKSYLKNKAKTLQRNYKRRQELRDWLIEIKRNLKCEKCLENDVAVLDFHHKDGETKEKGISQMISNMNSKEKILEEISKCIILCSNCHRKLHWNEVKVVNSLESVEQLAGSQDCNSCT